MTATALDLLGVPDLTADAQAIADRDMSGKTVIVTCMFLKRSYDKLHFDVYVDGNSYRNSSRRGPCRRDSIT